MDALVQDLRYAVRGLVSRPGFTLIALLTLALGVGANTAIFSVVNGVVLKPLPYEHEDRVVRVQPEQLFMGNGFSNYIRDNNTAFEVVAGWGRGVFLFTGGDRSEEFRGGYVATDHFDMLGAQPVLGRGFLREEGETGNMHVLILSHAVWTARFGADPSIVGSEVKLSSGPWTVVGVMGPEYQAMEPDWAIWAPASHSDPEHWHRDAGTATNGRLRVGVTLSQAQEDVERLMFGYSELRGWGMTRDEISVPVVPIREWILGDMASRVMILSAAAAAILLIACANLANLLLALGGSRAREIAVRFAMGAGRGRIVRQLMTESALLGLVGGVAGVMAAWAVHGLTVASLPAEVPRVQAIEMDSSVLIFGLGVAFLASLIFGVVPALKATGGGLSSQLKDGARGGIGRGRHRLNHSLVALEMAMAVVLVLGSSLMLRSFQKLLAVDPGFDGTQVVTMRPRLFGERYQDPDQILNFLDQVEVAIAAAPGVESVGAISILPMTSGGAWGVYYNPDNARPEGNFPQMAMRQVTPSYHATMGIPLIEGRFLTASDRSDTGLVVLINQTMARDAFGDEPAAGRLLALGSGDEPEIVRVVGVVGDVRQSDLRTDIVPELYWAFAQNPTSRIYLTARVTGDPESMLVTVQNAVWSVDRSLPLLGVNTVENVVRNTTENARFFTYLLAAFGFIALSLGAIGVYGVMSYVVGQELKEIGIRLALGADASQVLRRTLLTGMVSVTGGVVLGLGVAFLASSTLSAFLFEVSAFDLTSFAITPLVLVVVALTALFIPARRASRVDPIKVLRTE